MKLDYAKKFESYRGRTLFEALDPDERRVVEETAFRYRLTFQEFREVAQASRDLSIWGEGGLRSLRVGSNGNSSKTDFLQSLRESLSSLQAHPGAYDSHPSKPLVRQRKPVVSRATDKKIWGMCPVASEKTVCCNLRTIDAVENCVFGCSYCTVQTFYTDNIVFDDSLPEKLRAIELEPGRFYHFGTGQASDSLAWGNRGGVLDALCDLASRHPNILLELKTKSDNVRYFMENDVPENVVCSWSLNTPAVIAAEEHFTADLDRRLGAARAVADRGVRVAFHFHPMVRYAGWKDDYPSVAEEVMGRFHPSEVAFVSFGSVTLIKPVLAKIRELGNPTKIHRAELVPDPHGKLTYKNEVKIEMFRTMHDAFAPWRDEVFTYLCMEKASIWKGAFGRVYGSNEEFERDFGRRVMAPLTSRLD